MKKQSGFTLIELMIVVAIIAILAAIAMPAYKSYVARSKFTEVEAGASALKTQVQLCFLDKGALTTCSNTATTAASGAGWTINAGNDYKTKYINSLVVTAGVIAATASAAEGLVDTGGTAATFVLTPASTAAGSIEWTSSGTCKAAGLC